MFDNVYQNIVLKWKNQPRLIWKGKDENGNKIQEDITRWVNQYGMIQYGLGDGVLMLSDNGLKLFWINKKKFISKESNIFRAWFRVKKVLTEPHDTEIEAGSVEMKNKGKEIKEKLWMDV